jgi:hypothetical protein
MVNATQNVYVREKKAWGDAIIQVKILLSWNIKAELMVENFSFYNTIIIEHCIVVKLCASVQALLEAWGHWRIWEFTHPFIQWLFIGYLLFASIQGIQSVFLPQWAHAAELLIHLWALLSLSIKCSLVTKIQLSRRLQSNKWLFNTGWLYG